MKENLISVYGSEYELDHNENRITENEEELLEKTRICKVIPEKRN